MIAHRQNGLIGLTMIKTNQNFKEETWSHTAMGKARKDPWDSSPFINAG